VVLAVVALQKGKTLSWDIGSASAEAADKWVKIEAPVEVPDGCDAVYVRFVGERDTVAWVDDVELRPWKLVRRQKPRVKGHAAERVRERLGRGLVAVPIGDGKVYVGWRLLETEPPEIAFNLYRRTKDAAPVKVNAAPILKTTDFTDTAGAGAAYLVRPLLGGKEGAPSPTVRVAAAPHIAIRLDGDHTFQKVGIADLDGDGRLDFVIKQPHNNIDPWYKYWRRSPETYKLEAYRHDGTLLWRHDLGWAIERGIWYSPYVVYDLDGDGKAEVAVKTGEGDPRDAEGKVQSGPEHLSVLDGLTGKLRARADWPSREPFKKMRHGYNYASRNQMCVAYLDGKTPCLVVERGTYNIITLIAYEFHRGKLRRLWRWCNKDETRRYWGQGAHWMHAADVDADGRDEVVIGSAVIDDNGVGLWSTGLGHPDHCYVGDIDPSRPGLEIYYGMETRQRERNGMCLVDAKTGKILWGHEGFTRHVHSRGMCSDIDARYAGSECFSTDTDSRKKPAWSRLRTCKGKVISEDMSWGFGPLVVHWDADPQRELLRRGRISKYGGPTLPPRIEGRLVAVADVLGDWREEIITSVGGELRIYTTTIPAADRRACLMHDPLYRMDVVAAAMGYYQVPMTSYDLATRKPR
jgi:rhamnogalacturonan endolyase